MPRWRVFWKLRAIILAKMSDCGTFAKLEAMILSEHASEMLRWRAFWKLDAIRLPKYTSKMSNWKNPEKLKAMILSEYASEMPRSPALDGFSQTRAIILQIMLPRCQIVELLGSSRP